MTPNLLSIAATRVVSEVIEGEAIIIDMDTGTYFNANGTGSLLWSLLLDAARSEMELIAAFHVAFPKVDRAAMEADVRAFLAQLRERELVSTIEQDSPSADVGVPSMSKRVPAYEPPILEVHTDMQDFLLVDPIHDVTADGRPRAQEEE
jgi:hypothetical protein